MGQYATCSNCDFQFNGGHNHHTGESICICLFCCTEFACPTESSWGPNIGETIELIQIVRDANGRNSESMRRSTGIKFVAEQGESVHGRDGEDYLVNYPLETVPCPHCDSRCLAGGLENGSACPRCKVGQIEAHGIIY